MKLNHLRVLISVVQRNEAQYHDETLPGYRASVEPQMVKTGMATALYYTDLVSPDGQVKLSPEVPELLPFTDFYKQMFGKAPSGIKYEALKAANMSSTNLQRLILLPPGAPGEAVTALRRAFASLSKDVDFIADAIKTLRFHPTFEVGKQGERLFQQVSQTSPEVIDFIRQYIEQANR